MNILENISLATYTTFQIGGPARYFCAVSRDEELLEAVAFAKKKNIPIFILGGGSNILISDDGFPGIVIKNEYRGVKIDGERVKAGAGEMWDELVEKTVSAGLYGLENLSAIPGTVGAAPVQNIGAYGVEISNMIESVRIYSTKTLGFRELSPADCKFGYRDSVFKHKKARYVITDVNLKLKKDGQVHTEYGGVKEYLLAKKIVKPTLEQMRQAIIDIRWAKLPDWKLWGTAGSYFKNPVISPRIYKKLIHKYPGMPGYYDRDGRIKVSLAWILENICQAKNICIGQVCTYERHALVLVAKPGATAKEVVELSNALMHQVKEKTGIAIEAEVEWVN